MEHTSVPPDHPLVDAIIVPELFHHCSIIVPDALGAWPMSPTRAGLAMSCLSQDRLEDRLEDLLSTGARYSESTIRKHKWVVQLYKSFSDVTKTLMFVPFAERNCGWLYSFSWS